MIESWYGVLNAPVGNLILAIYLSTNNSEVVGEVEVVNQAPGQRVPMSEVLVSDDRLEFEIDALGASFAGRWNPTKGIWEGTFRQGVSLPLDLMPGEPMRYPIIENLEGVWEGEINLNAGTLRLMLNMITSRWGTIVTLDSPDQMIRGIPVSEFSFNGSEISFRIAPGNQRFAGHLRSDGQPGFQGQWTSDLTAPVAVTFRPKGDAVDDAALAIRPQTPIPPFSYQVESVEFPNLWQSDVTLAGTLTIPQGEGPFPAVVLISGSGPHDRDETVFGHKPFAVLADHLTRCGIAVLRFDDRGVGESTGHHAESTSADFASDAKSALEFLASRKGVQAYGCGFIGHSEGGLVATMAAENSDAAFIVMLATPGLALNKVIMSQLKVMGVQAGMTDEAIADAESVLCRLFEAVAGSSSEEEAVRLVDEALSPEARAALGVAAAKNPAWLIKEFANPWLRFLLRHDPISGFERVQVPVLALYGGLDVQVLPDQNIPVVIQAFRHNTDASVIMLKDLNHLFQTAQSGSAIEYSSITETFSEFAMEVISDWIVDRFKSKN
jgi:hypothetical protein